MAVAVKNAPLGLLLNAARLLMPNDAGGVWGCISKCRDEFVASA
jgi:hypothetical protein